VPLFLALTLSYVGWRLLHTGGPLYLGEAAKWAAVGCVGAALVSGLIVDLQVVQGEIKPVVIVVQFSVVGAIAGLWTGRSGADVEESRRMAREEQDRLENLLKGLPAPVVHGRFEGDALTVLQVNRAFEDVFGAGADGGACLNGGVSHVCASNEDRTDAHNRTSPLLMGRSVLCPCLSPYDGASASYGPKCFEGSS